MRECNCGVSKGIRSDHEGQCVAAYRQPLSIGMLGNRSHLITKVLPKHLLESSVSYLTHHKEITSAFDIVFCLGYYKLIKAKHFNRPRFGAFVLHATDLPKGRGWAPVNWALINKHDKIHVTSFKVDEGCDTGPYFMKSSCDISITDTHDSAYKKVDTEIVNHINQMLSEIVLTGNVVLHDQVGEPTWNPKRTANDSELDADKSLRNLWPLIRACNNQDYPAFFKLNGKKIYLRYEVEENEING